jgi:hypothetical protein
MKSLSHWVEKKLMYSEPADSAGVKHMLCTQRRDMSCGMACVAMVVQRVRGIRLLESALRGYSKCFYQGPGSNSKAYDRNEGTEIFNLAIMLKKMCVPAEHKSTGRAKTTLPGVSAQKPIIALVNWNGGEGALGGGGHFIVVDSYDASNGAAVICDPAYGLVECRVDGGVYSPEQGTTGGFSGHWVLTL